MTKAGIRGRGALVAAILLLAGRVEAADVQLFAIGYKHLLDDAKNYADYRARLLGLAAAADREPQKHDPPKVFLFPEDSALYAMFIGGRGARLRSLEPTFRQGDGNGSSLAVAGLFAAYQEQAAYYRAKFPKQNLSEARLGLLALTDTIYRSFFESFREIAIRHHAWVIAAANVAPAKITRRPLAAELLADPEQRRESCGEIPAPCAYEAASPNVYNQAFVFTPDGDLAFNPFERAREGKLDGAVKKTYLVPIEQGPLEKGKIGLDLAYGDLRQVRPIEVAGVPMGILISKPAWMLDELGRLEAYDAQVLLQPEAFSGWGSPVEDWNPDVLKQSSWAHVQKSAPFRYGALAELTGNFFDLVFDAQNHIVEKARSKSLAARRSIGQPPDVGWLQVSPWVAPSELCDQDRLVDRRVCLADIGRRLAPASGDELENDYADPSSVEAEISLAPPPIDTTRARGVLGDNFRVDDAPAGKRARNPRAALAPDGSTLVVWQQQEGDGGVDQVHIARVASDGVVSASQIVAPEPLRRQVFPQVAVTAAGATWVVWQELDPRPHVMAAAASALGGTFDPPFPLSQNTPFAAEEWKPAIAAEGNTLHVAHVALDETFGLPLPGSLPLAQDISPAAPLLPLGAFEHIVYTRLIHHGPGDYTVEFRAIDERAFPAADPLAERLNNRWSPAIAARGDTVAIAWSDFRNYSWDLYAAVSRNGGNSFLDEASPPENLRVDDAGRLGGAAAGLERLHDDAAINIAPDGTVEVAWTDQAGRRAGCASCAQQRRPDADVAFARLTPGASEFSPNVRIDGTGDGLQTENRIGFSNQWRPALARDPARGRLVAVWQDHREGNNDVYLSTSSDGGVSWSTSQRVDDTGDGPSNQYAPTLTIDAQGKLTTLWQDDRDGAEHIYMARGTLPS